MIADITKFLEEHHFFKDSTIQDIIIPNGADTLFLILNDKTGDSYKKNLLKLTFSGVEKTQQTNNGIKPDKISNQVDSIHSKSPQMKEAYTVEITFSDTRRIEITFQHLDCAPYSDEQDIIISK